MYRLIEDEKDLEAWVLRTEYGPHLWEWLGGIATGVVIGAASVWLWLT